MSRRLLVVGELKKKFPDQSNCCVCCDNQSMKLLCDSYQEISTNVKGLKKLIAPTY